MCVCGGFFTCLIVREKKWKAKVMTNGEFCKSQIFFSYTQKMEKKLFVWFTFACVDKLNVSNFAIQFFFSLLLLLQYSLNFEHEYLLCMRHLKYGRCCDYSANGDMLMSRHFPLDWQSRSIFTYQRNKLLITRIDSTKFFLRPVLQFMFFFFRSFSFYHSHITIDVKKILCKYAYVRSMQAKK